MNRCDWMVGLGLLACAGCQGLKAVESHRLGAARATPSPVELKIGFTGDPAKTSAAFPRKRVARMTFADGGFISKARVRVPQEGHILLTLDPLGGAAIAAAEFLFRSTTSGFESTLRFQRAGDGSFEGVVTDAVIAEAFRSRERIVQGRIEVLQESGQRDVYRVELPISVTFPNLKVRTLGKLSGNVARTPRARSAEIVSWSGILAEDLEITNPSRVPIQVMYRLQDSGGFRLTTRLHQWTGGGLIDGRKDGCRLDGGPEAGPGFTSVASYLSTPLIPQFISVRRSGEGNGKEMERFAANGEWFVAGIPPGESVSISLSLQTEAAKPFAMIGETPCEYQYTTSEGLLGVFAEVDTGVAGKFRRTIAVTAPYVSVRELEAVLQGDRVLKEEGKFLTANRLDPAAQSPELNFHYSKRGVITDEEIENPSPLHVPEPSIRAVLNL